MTPIPLADRPTTVYRLFDSDGVLLYVGVSWNPKSRIPSHQDKPWWPRVAKSTTETHPDRLTALRFEAKAITEESPLFNIAAIAPDRVRAPRCKDEPRDHSGRTWKQAIRAAGIRPWTDGRRPSEEEQVAALTLWHRWKQEAGVS